MENKETKQRAKLLMDVIVVLAIIVCCFLYVEHYNQIQEEVNAILMSSVEDLNNSLANSASTK